MIESGLRRFYEQFAQFLVDLRIQKVLNAQNDDSHVINLDDLRGPLILCSFLMVVAGIVFLVEVIIHKLKLRQQRK